MGRCGQHGQRAGLTALDILAMEGVQGDTEPFRTSANFVQRNKPIVKVEGRILDPLGHDRAGDLLKALHEIEPRCLELVIHEFGKTEQENIPDKVEN